MSAKILAVLAAATYANMAYAAKAVDAKTVYNPAPSTSTTMIKPGEKGKSVFVDGADELLPMGPAVSNLELTRYADPVWDKQFAGQPVYWMGLGHGGCGYGNLLDVNKYPYMFGISLSDGARKALGFTKEDGVGCGACIRATCVDDYKPYCPLGATSAVGVVLDVCPTEDGHDSGKACSALQADMYIGAWEFATGKSPSNPKVELQRVMCPDPKTNIFMMVMYNKGPWQFIKFNLQNVGGTGIIAKVSMTCTDEGGRMPKTIDLENTYGAVWQADNQPEKVDKCMLTITGEDGTVLKSEYFNELPIGQEEDYPFVAVVDLGVQFPNTSKLALANSTVALGPTASLAVAGRRLLQA